MALLVLGACEKSRDEAAADALGPEVGDPGPTHRPGEPCLVCHDERDGRGEKLFVVAGTVYERASDTRGTEGVEVVITDAEDQQLSVFTNEAGNFWISVDPDVAVPELDEEGGLDVPRAPVFPLRVAVRRGAFDENMAGVIGREGSCAHCHFDPPGATSAGKIFLVEEP